MPARRKIVGQKASLKIREIWARPQGAMKLRRMLCQDAVSFGAYACG